MHPPSVVVFDVNETLSDMSGIAARFREVGAPEQLARLWFSVLLRDGFALTAAGGHESFANLARGALHQVFDGVPLDRERDAAVEHVVDGFFALPTHPDVADGVRALRRAGMRLVTLSNGPTKVADRLLRGAGIRDEFEALLTVEDIGIWKPARSAYGHAARRCDTDLPDMMLVAVHPWDIDGAARSGMATAWINRTGAGYPEYFVAPTVTVPAITELAPHLS